MGLSRTHIKKNRQPMVHKHARRRADSGQLDTPINRWRGYVEKAAAILIEHMEGIEWRIAADDLEKWKSLGEGWLRLMSQR